MKKLRNLKRLERFSRSCLSLCVSRVAPPLLNQARSACLRRKGPSQPLPALRVTLSFAVEGSCADSQDVSHRCLADRLSNKPVRLEGARLAAAELLFSLPSCSLQCSVVCRRHCKWLADASSVAQQCFIAGMCSSDRIQLLSHTSHSLKNGIFAPD